MSQAQQPISNTIDDQEMQPANEDNAETLATDQYTATEINEGFKKGKVLTVLSHSIFGFIIRLFQLAFAIIVMGLAAGSLNDYASTASMSFMVFTAVFTLVYFIVMVIINFIRADAYVVGVNMIWEVLLTIFWFSSFIAVAAIYGGGSCDNIDYYNYVWGYIYYFNGNACRASKAAIVFAALNFVLFAISLLALSLSATSYLSYSDQYFQPINKHQIILNKPLLVVTSVGVTTQFKNGDLENGAAKQTETQEPKFDDDSIVPPPAAVIH